MDLRGHEVLANEAETFTEDKHVDAAWANAASCVDSPSDITILQDIHNGKLYVGYHRTLSELTIPELVRLGQYIMTYEDKLCLEIKKDGKEAWMIFMWPWRIVKKSSAGELKKKIKRVDDLINKIWAP
jgi:hypothetical protein